MAEDLRSSARLSWIMFHLPCSPQYHVVREGVEGSHRIAARRGDHGRHEPDREMECGNALDCWCQLFLPALPGPARGSRQAMAGLGALSGLRPAVLTPERLTLPHSRKRPVARQPQVPQDLVSEQTGSRKEPAPMVKPSVPRVRQSTSSSATRLIVSTGLFVSAILLLVAYLDRSSHRLAIFGTLTVIFLILLMRMPRSR